jgi:dihydroorotate dehydrogenase
VGDGPALAACGGVASADDVSACLDAGATTVQIYTAMIYDGPSVVGELTAGLGVRSSVLRGR